jgi:hypothetical protein
MIDMDKSYQNQGAVTQSHKINSYLEMGTKRMGHDRPQGVWRYYVGPPPIYRTSKHGDIQYMSKNTITLLANHNTMRHIICSYDGPHLTKKM